MESISQILPSYVLIPSLHLFNSLGTRTCHVVHGNRTLRYSIYTETCNSGRSPIVRCSWYTIDLSQSLLHDGAETLESYQSELESQTFSRTSGIPTYYLWNHSYSQSEFRSIESCCNRFRKYSNQSYKRLIANADDRSVRLLGAGRYLAKSLFRCLSYLTGVFSLTNVTNYVLSTKLTTVLPTIRS